MMKKLLLLVGLVVFLISSSLYSKEWSNWDKAKDNPKEYLEHITRLAGALYVCEDLNKFHIANALFNWDYITLTDERCENLLSKDERNEVWQNFKVNVKEFIKNKKIHEKTIKDLGGCNLIGEEVRDYFFSRYALSAKEYNKGPSNNEISKSLSLSNKFSYSLLLNS